MKITWATKTRFILTAMLLAAVCLGCSAQPTNDSAVETLNALRTAAVRNTTASAQPVPIMSIVATTSEPAAATSPVIDDIQTAQPTIPKPNGTEAAKTMTAIPIFGELSLYGLGKSRGRVGWVHDPLTLEITGYQQFAYGNDHREAIAADFALAADITWDTQYGSSGCGFMFRSDGNQNKPSQYMVIATRFANGHVVFTALADGELANIHDFYPKSEDRKFQADNETTNRLAVIARGTIIEIYTNGAKIGEVDTTKPPAQLPAPPKPVAPVDQKDLSAMNAYNNQMKEYGGIVQQSQSSYQLAVKNYMNRPAVFDEGFLAMFAASESGRTVCTFKNAWLWLIDK